MPPLNLLIKPASSSCNLKCRYCFYHDVSQNRRVASYGMMDTKLLEKIVKSALEHADGLCTFAFQGGEPTLIGLDYYEKLMELEKKYNTKKVRISNSLQTNGLLIDEGWAKFLAGNDFLVGISLDGPKDIHDANRINGMGAGSYNSAMNAIELFNKYGVEYNVLSVVNSYVARHAGKVYNFFKKNGFKFLQFIPCLDPINGQPEKEKFSLKPERFGYFLKNLFDLWYEDLAKGSMTSIRYFDNLAGMFAGCGPEACGMSGHCHCQFVIEADGGVYPCDFYVMDKWLLGNIKDKGFHELLHSGACEIFINASNSVNPKCKACRWFGFCRGGCRRDREYGADGAMGLNYYCGAYEAFFEHAGERLRKIAAASRLRE